MLEWQRGTHQLIQVFQYDCSFSSTATSPIPGCRPIPVKYDPNDQVGIDVLIETLLSLEYDLETAILGLALPSPGMRSCRSGSLAQLLVGEEYLGGGELLNE